MNVSFLANGTPLSFTDKGTILNTFGGSADGNNWNVIGTAPSRGGTAVPEPSSLLLLDSGLMGVEGIARRKFLR
jgi:hypothetical protein